MNLQLLIILGVILVFMWYLYNSIIVAKLRVSESLSHIDVQLKRRADLIPNLIETVKGYAKHEKELFEKVTRERASLVSAKSLDQKAKINNQLTETFKSIFAVAEGYPELKASQNFIELQEELSDTENKIAYARQFYNSNVLNYNTKLKVFPNVLFVKFLNFREAEFFGATEAEKKEIKVSF